MYENINECSEVFCNRKLHEYKPRKYRGQKFRTHTETHIKYAY